MKTRKLTEVEKSIVLGYADSQFTSPYGECAKCLTHAAMSPFRACDGTLARVMNIDELSLHLDSVTVEAE